MLSAAKMSPVKMYEAAEPSSVAVSGAMPDIPTLNSLAVRSLIALFDEEEQLFAERVMVQRQGFRRDRTSRRHTLVALLGLHRLAASGERQPFDIAAIGEGVLRDHSWVNGVEDLGLLTWFTAACRPDRLGEILREFDFDHSLRHYKDGREAYTKALAWFLAGIAHARSAFPAASQFLTDVAVDAYRMLQENQSQQGIFGHAGAASFPKKASYSRLGTFTDQISAIYALSMFAQAFQIEEPLEAALACANSVCALQGELGQWWFLYDKRTGRVANRYPVLSLHQYGTAPCGLLALGEATGRSFDAAISKGLNWIAGANELANDLRSVEPAFIWDSIGLRGGFARYWASAWSFLHPSSSAAPEDLKVRHESRSDHLGWLLYALGNFGLPKSAAAGVTA
jgi:hypothetical protein